MYLISIKNEFPPLVCVLLGLSVASLSTHFPQRPQETVRHLLLTHQHQSLRRHCGRWKSIQKLKYNNLHVLARWYVFWAFCIKTETLLVKENYLLTCSIGHTKLRDALFHIVMTAEELKNIVFPKLLSHFVDLNWLHKWTVLIPEIQMWINISFKIQ